MLSARVSLNHRLVYRLALLSGGGWALLYASYYRYRVYPYHVCLDDVAYSEQIC